MRGEIREGRFDIHHERESIISGTSKELVHTVGSEVEWWFFDQANTVIDPIYDVGSSTGTGRIWKGPVYIPVANASLLQGVTVQSDRGFYNTDILKLTINVDIVEERLALKGESSASYPNFNLMEVNPDYFLRDRIVFRHEVFTPTRVFPVGIIKDKYTLLSIELNQVNPEELVNDSQFQQYANYNPYNPSSLPSDAI
jgi:hypothetical protein